MPLYEEVQSVCFVGSGAMGCFNALVAGAAGLNCSVYDSSQTAMTSLPERLRAMGGHLCQQGFFSSDDLTRALDGITPFDDLRAAIAGATLVSESVPEQPEIKRAVLAELDGLCGEHVIITTNTSTLLPSELEGALAKPERFAALHSHLGAKVFDIVGGSRTDPQLLEQLEAYVRCLGGYPLLLSKENPGYVINSILGPLLTASLLLMTEKVVSAEVIDRAWMRSQSVAIGPVGLMDLFGLDVIFDSWQRPGRRNHPLRPRILAQLAPLIESNALGIKSGQGFYNYPDPAYAQAEFLVGTTNDKTIESCLIAVFLTHALALEVNGVTEAWKVDEAWTLSFGSSEGPFAQLQALGIPALKKYQDEALRRGLLDGDVLSLVSEHLTNTASPN